MVVASSKKAYLLSSYPMLLCLRKMGSVVSDTTRVPGQYA
jgi:hypothetical protein